MALQLSGTADTAIQPHGSGWHGRLELRYGVEDTRSVARFRHQGPLRVLQSLYPEGDRICHNVLVHPPGGLVGGDVLDIDIEVAPQSHGLITTPGATRFYRTVQGQATQQVHARLHDDSRLEWLPLETLAYHQCDGVNRAVFSLAPRAELLAWDITALGLPAAGQPFAQGRLQQHFEITDAWLERGCIEGSDALLLDGPLGLDGHRCLGTLVFASGSAWPSQAREQLLDIARAHLPAPGGEVVAGVTAAHPRVIVLRTLSALVEPTQTLLRAVWLAWRQAQWQLDGAAPRIWSM